MAEDVLNVLLLAGRFEVRGTSNYTLRLAEHLPEHGIRPTIICSDSRQIVRSRREELSIHEFRNLNVPVIGRVVREWMVAALRDAPPDVIHIQSRPLHDLGSWLARRLDRPYVLTAHDFPPRNRRKSWSERYGRKLIAVSGSVRTTCLQHFGIPDSRTTVIHSGVEVSPQVECMPVLDPGHVPIIGTAGPLEAVKGLPYFLSAAQRVLLARDDVQFLVAGAGPEEYNLRRLARELQIDTKVTFVPRLQDFTPSLAAMDIFCLSSLQQGLGSIMLEAMALGKPVIATGVGGIYSVVRDGETGLIVPPSESRPLAERMLVLLDDPVRARKIGEAGRALVRREFRVETMVELTAGIYRQSVEAVEPAAKA